MQPAERIFCRLRNSIIFETMRIWLLTPTGQLAEYIPGGIGIEAVAFLS